MITRFPILEFLSNRAGTYASADGRVQLELASCGYGFTLDATGETKRGRLSGVVGVAGPNLELHALVGLANVIRFAWLHEFREFPRLSEVEIKLHSVEIDSSVILHFSQGLLRFGLVAGKQAKALHELHLA